MRRSLQQRVSRPWDWSPQKQVEPWGFSSLCHLTKAPLSQEAWGGGKCHSGLHPAPTKPTIVLGGSGISAHRDLPHGLNVTSRVGALLSSQPFWGIIVGSERAGKTFPESVGGRKATLHAGNTSDVWKTLKCVFPEVKSSAEWSLQVEGGHLCSARPLPTPRGVCGDSWAGEGLPYSHLYGWASQYLPSASSGK